LQLLTSLLSQLLFEEVKCQWSMSRPLLGLIILNMQGGRFEACRTEFINAQPAQFHQALQQVRKGEESVILAYFQSFDRLMEGISLNVSLKNKVGGAPHFSNSFPAFPGQLHADSERIPKGGGSNSSLKVPKLVLSSPHTRLSASSRAARSAALPLPARSRSLGTA
jgi:hypothetical protein